LLKLGQNGFNTDESTQLALVLPHFRSPSIRQPEAWKSKRIHLFVVTMLAMVAQIGAVTHPRDVEALKEVVSGVALANLIILFLQFHLQLES
jgi:hypothetical protein